MVFSIQRDTILPKVQLNDPTTRDTTKDNQILCIHGYIVIANQSYAGSKVAMDPWFHSVRRLMWLLSCEKADDVRRDAVLAVSKKRRRRLLNVLRLVICRLAMSTRRHQYTINSAYT